MNVKEDLQEMRAIRKLIQSKTRQIEELEEAKTTIKSPKLTGMPKSPGTSNTNKLDKIIDDINKLQDFKREQLEKLIAIEQKYVEAASILCPTFKLIIELRYFENEDYTWDKIADKIGYDTRHIYNLHGQALLKLRDILNN